MYVDWMVQTLSNFPSSFLLNSVTILVSPLMTSDMGGKWSEWKQSNHYKYIWLTNNNIVNRESSLWSVTKKIVLSSPELWVLYKHFLSYKKPFTNWACLEPYWENINSWSFKNRPDVTWPIYLEPIFPQ